MKFRSASFRKTLRFFTRMERRFVRRWQSDPPAVSLFPAPARGEESLAASVPRKVLPMKLRRDFLPFCRRISSLPSRITAKMRFCGEIAAFESPAAFRPGKRFATSEG
jgi:hypothetical protein